MPTAWRQKEKDAQRLGLRAEISLDPGCLTPKYHVDEVPWIFL